MESCAQNSGATIPCKNSGIPRKSCVNRELGWAQRKAVADALLTADNAPTLSKQARTWLTPLGLAALIAGNDRDRRND